MVLSFAYCSCSFMRLYLHGNRSLTWFSFILFSLCIQNEEEMTLLTCSIHVDTGLMDNVFSDYLWVKATHLTSTTVATAGLSIQVPIAAVVDTLTGHAPKLLDYIGAVAVMIGFAGINIPSDDSHGSQTAESGSIIVDDGHLELVENEGADDAQ